LTFILIEIAANYYLWNLAPEDKFNLYASIEQVKERYGQDFYISEDKTEFQPHHYLGYVPTYGYDDGLDRHNAFGFRGDDVSIDKPESIYRIVAIGASTTYSTSVDSYEESYPEELEHYLNDNGYSNVEVINAGVPGYTSHETLINLQLRVLDLEPDLVIIYQGNNDVHSRLTWPPEQYWADNSGFRAPLVQDTVVPKIWEYSTALRILGIVSGWTISQSSIDWNRTRFSSSSYYTQFQSQYFSGRYPSDFFTEVSALEMLQTNEPIYFERNLHNMVVASNENSADVLLLTFAVSEDSSHFKASSDEYIFARRQHNDITREIAQAYDTYFIDLADVFPTEMSYFTDGIHMNADGNRLRAEIIGEYIIENLSESMTN
jgi:lysophospholipase L1-like esterase